ncbi:MAG TPA: imelysin family protein [Polyangiaceae bacterium]|nr:imelysin family protein [Polyangiaceae bacterium]
MKTAASGLLLTLLLIVAAPQACVESTSSRRGAQQSGAGPSGGPTAGSGTGSSGFDKRALLAHLGQEVIVTVYIEFAAAAASVEAAAVGYASSLGDREALEDAWRDAMAIWEQAEVMLVGPAGDSGATAGGRDLRHEIYSWPLVNRCLTDQKLVSGEYLDPEAFKNQLITARGLAALEYLIFNQSTQNACSPQSSINAQGTWAAIVDELPQRRADYAVTLAQLLHEQAAALLSAWVAEQGNFVGELASAGNGSTVYASDQAALNAISDALFYLDIKTKDVKLAVPVGLTDCATAICPEALESTYAGFAKDEVRANIVGFARIFHGGAREDADALGFDDWLVAAGAPELAERMGDDIEAALAAVDAIEEDDLADALVADKASVESLYLATKAITDELKSQFVTVLDLELPQGAEGDND